MFIRNGQALGSINYALLESRAERPKKTKTAPPVTEQPQPEPTEVSEPPKEYAPKGDWVEFAVSQGADRSEAEDSTKNELIELYGGGS